MPFAGNHRHHGTVSYPPGTAIASDGGAGFATATLVTGSKKSGFPGAFDYFDAMSQNQGRLGCSSALFEKKSQGNALFSAGNLQSQSISCHDIRMKSKFPADSSDSLLAALAEFRFELRSFLHFSECAAQEVGLHPQQHQLLLQVAGAPKGRAVTIAYAAERLGLKHNSAVELVDRSEREGLLARTEDSVDKRRAILQVTRKGKKVLARLTASHARELTELGPRLAQVLKRISVHAGTGSSVEVQ